MQRDQFLRLVWSLLFAATVLTVVAARIRLLPFPLERDEGEYAYAGQLIRQGIPPYKLAYNMKFPGTYAAYALLMSVFGENVRGIHAGLLLVNLVTIAGVLSVVCNVLGYEEAVAAATSYAVLSLSPSVQGFAAHATHFVVLMSIAGAIAAWKGFVTRSKPLLFFSGALFSGSVLMKQPGAVFLVLAAAFLCAAELRRARGSWKQLIVTLALFSSGAAATLGFTAFLLWRAGVFARFWFWAIDYAGKYGSLVSPGQGLEHLKEVIPLIVQRNWPLLIIATLGALCVFLQSSFHRTLLWGLFAASWIAVSAGFYYRPHYFVLLLPVISLSIGYGVAALRRLPFTWKAASFGIFVAALAYPMIANAKFLFVTPVDLASRRLYYQDLFPECIPIAKYIEEHTSPADSIAVLGSEPQIYFYAHRHSATGYIYTYALMERQPYAQRMQREMIDEIEAARPRYLVLVIMEDSWLATRQSDLQIMRWASQYAVENYTAVGLVNIPAKTRANYYFDSIPPVVERLKNYILIYRLNS